MNPIAAQVRFLKGNQVEKRNGETGGDGERWHESDLKKPASH